MPQTKRSETVSRNTYSDRIVPDRTEAGRVEKGMVRLSKVVIGTDESNRIGLKRTQDNIRSTSDRLISKRTRNTYADRTKSDRVGPKRTSVNTNTGRVGKVVTGTDRIGLNRTRCN